MEPVSFGVPIVAATTAIVQGAKQVGLPGQWAPIFSLIVGTAWSVGLSISNGLQLDGNTISSGILLGSSASGLYAGIKALRGAGE